MSDINFNGKVAIITGAGLGLGRAHAFELAKRGAKVIINDLSQENAAQTAADINALGFEALPFAASVTDENAIAQMVEFTMQNFGRIDFLINNAGILRDKSFAKMELADLSIVLDVHVKGSFIPTKAVWEIMKAQDFGRIIFTTSSSGLYGNFGQANYGAAKMALVGLMNTLKIEGAKYNIKVNAIAPVAATQMTEGLIPSEMLELLKPQTVSPAISFLCDEDAPTGTIIAAGAGSFAIAKIIETQGMNFKDEAIKAESIKANFEKISDVESAKSMYQGSEQTQKLLGLAIS